MVSRRSLPAPAQSLTAYRIADGRQAIFDGVGAMLTGGRWNSPGRPVIYASLSYAAAMLERLVHAGSARIPRQQKSIVIRIPGRVSVERRADSELPRGWDAEDCIVSRRFGGGWIESRRSAVLIVPSVIARFEQNAVINPAHPDVRRITTSRPVAVRWDERLFGSRRP